MIWDSSMCSSSWTRHLIRCSMHFPYRILLEARLSMTEEQVQQSYRGVVCLHCKNPIPISPLVASIEAERPADETTPRRHQKCQVFHLRCAACGKEKPYKIDEIREFEGSPITESSRAQPASTYLRRISDRSRTAHA